MGPAGRTAPTGARNRAGPRIGVGKSVVAAAGAGRRARGPGRAQRAAAAGSGLGRRRAASVLVSCFCKASFDCRGERRDSSDPGEIPPPASWGFSCRKKRASEASKPKSSPFPPPNLHSKGLSLQLSSCLGGGGESGETKCRGGKGYSLQALNAYPPAPQGDHFSPPFPPSLKSHWANPQPCHSPALLISNPALALQCPTPCPTPGLLRVPTHPAACRQIP